MMNNLTKDLRSLFKKKPELKITVFYSTSRGTRRTKVMSVDELPSQKNVYQIHLDAYQTIRVEVESNV